MQTYLGNLDLWEIVEKNYIIDLLSKNPTIDQIKMRKEKMVKLKSCFC